MTFHDLPKDWPHRSLADPRTAADVLDLCVSDRDRSAGGLSVLLCRHDHTLAQPVFVGPLDDAPDLPDLLDRLVEMTTSVPGVAALVLAVVRSWGGVSDADRRLHQHAIEVCRARGVDLLGTYLVTGLAVTRLPVADHLVAPQSPDAA